MRGTGTADYSKSSSRQPQSRCAAYSAHILRLASYTVAQTIVTVSIRYSPGLEDLEGMRLNVKQMIVMLQT
jgi:hypothetical protein